MGVDIYGLSPTLKSERPQLDWDSASEENKSAYFEYLSQWEEENPGDYFRSNWWGWRPIVLLCEIADEKFDLDIDFSYWGSNDGAGLKTQEECTRLAESLENIIGEFFDNTDTHILQLCTGMWVTQEGMFLTDEEKEELNEQYPFGTILDKLVVTSKGNIAHSAHSVQKEHVQYFISFLKECGGFEIW
mgnify:CR=1 FL=1